MQPIELVSSARSYFDKIRSSLLYYLKGLLQRIGSHNAFLLGGGLTFSFATCLIPFVLIAFAILGELLEAPEVEQQIARFIENVIPYQDSAAFVKSIVMERVAEFKQFKTLAGYIGAIGLFFAASGLVGSLRTILNTIYGIDAGKGVFVAKLRDVGIILLMVMVFLLSSILIPVIEIIRNFAGKIWFLNLFDLGFLEHFFLSLISFLIVLGIFYFIYYIIPYRKINKKVLLVSALCAAVLWELAKQVFGVYLSYSANLSRIYGAYLFIVVVFFWIYYSSLVIIIGAEMGQLYGERKNTVQSAKRE